MKKRWLIGSFATAGALYLLRRWGTRWGTTPAEFHQVLPGDEIVPHPDLSTTHAISIDFSSRNRSEKIPGSVLEANLPGRFICRKPERVTPD